MCLVTLFFGHYNILLYPRASQRNHPQSCSWSDISTRQADAGGRYDKIRVHLWHGIFSVHLGLLENFTFSPNFSSITTQIIVSYINGGKDRFVCDKNTCMSFFQLFTRSYQKVIKARVHRISKKRVASRYIPVKEEFKMEKKAGKLTFGIYNLKTILVLPSKLHEFPCSQLWFEEDKNQ